MRGRGRTTRGRRTQGWEPIKYRCEAASGLPDPQEYPAEAGKRVGEPGRWKSGQPDACACARVLVSTAPAGWRAQFKKSRTGLEQVPNAVIAARRGPTDERALAQRGAVTGLSRASGGDPCTDPVPVWRRTGRPAGHAAASGLPAAALRPSASSWWRHRSSTVARRRPSRSAACEQQRGWRDRWIRHGRSAAAQGPRLACSLVACYQVPGPLVALNSPIASTLPTCCFPAAGERPVAGSSARPAAQCDRSALVGFRCAAMCPRQQPGRASLRCRGRCSRVHDWLR